MAMIWILVANDSGARLFETSGVAKPIHRVRQWENPEGKKKLQAFEADRPGRSFDSTPFQRHSMSPEVNAHRHQEEIFSRKLSDFLEKSFDKSRFEELVLIAPPHLLGELRKVLSKDIKKVVRSELHKDFPVYMNDHELFRHFLQDLQLGTTFDVSKPPQATGARKI